VTPSHFVICWLINCGMPSGIEPEVKRYLKKVLNSLFIGLLWLLINSTLGIYFELGFVDGKVAIGNILFYLWLVASIVLLLWYYYRTWKSS
jgi:hypothetical protein